MLGPMLMVVTVAASLAGSDAPESAYWDATSRSWYVSNVSGTPAEKDGKGWISRLDAEGKLVKAVWVDGLNAPKGLRAAGNLLYVADIDELVVVDIGKAQIEECLKAPGAAFLNDVAVGPGGEIYATDTLANAIYRCPSGRDCEVFLQGESPLSPNGLLVEGDHLVVASWGLVTGPSTLGTTTPGHLLRVDLETKAVESLGDGRPVGNLDGIEADGSDYLVTDWVAGRLLRVSKSLTITSTAGT